MVVAFDVNQVREYSLLSDIGENRTVFLLGTLDSRLFCWISDKGRAFSVNNKGEDAPATVTVDIDMQNYNIVKFGLKGWTNFKDTKGNDVRFVRTSEYVSGVGERQAVSPECMDFIKPFITELANEIKKDNTLDKESEKNSGSLSQS